MPLIPEIPADARQTNCWKFAFILYLCLQIAGIVSCIFSGQWSQVITYVIDLIVWVIVMYHVAYVKVEVTEQTINISMGPWQWPLLRWCCSSQVSKEEIVLIERKQRQCLYDVCPRLYCSPIGWCCCHKQYSAYWWPCCCNDINVCGCCDGDSDSSDMIQINLTREPTEFTSLCFKRCAPCPIPWSIFVCCVYNRIAVSIKDESVWQAIQASGYPLSLSQDNERTALAPNTGTTTDPNEGQTRV